MGFFSSIIKGITGLLGDIVGFLIGVDFDDFDDQAQGALVNKQSNIDPIPVVYGKRKVGGVRVFVSTGGGKKNEYLYMAIVLSEGNIEAIDQIYVNDKLHTHSDYSGLITVDKKLGGDNQGYSSLLSGADDSWGTNHRLRGVAYLAIRIKYDQDVFGGIPEVQCVIRGRRVYDPRTSTTGYSTNPALCLRDYLTNSRYGKGLPTSAIDDTKFSAAANEYDGTETPYAGGAAITWIECNARLDTGKTVFDNVKEMLQGMRGLLPYTDGKYGLIVDKSESSSFDLTPDNILSDITVTDAGKGKRFNRVIAKFPNPAANWQMDSVTYPEKSTDSNSDFVTFLAEDNGEELIREINLNTITNLYQAREMARIVCEASRRNTRSVTLTATSEAMDIAVGDVVRLEQPSLGWTGASRQLMRVVSTRIKDNGEVDLSLIEYNDIYSWVTGSEENDNQDTTLPDPFGIEAPTVPATTEQSSLGPDGTVQPSVSFSWTEADDAFVSDYEVQWKLTSASDYTNFARTSESSVELFGLDVGSEYTFRVRSLNTLGVRSDFITTTRTLQGDTTPPGAITLGDITGGVRSIIVEWTNPTDLDYAFTEVHVTNTNTTPAVSASPTAKVAGEEYVYQQPSGTDGAVTKYFFLRPVDFSGNKGSYTGTSGNSGTSVQADSGDIAPGAVDTTEIADNAVTITKIADTLESTNYVAGTSGWRLTTAGDFEAGDGTFRGAVTATSITLDGTSITEGQLESAVQTSLGLADTATQNDTAFAAKVAWGYDEDVQGWTSNQMTVTHNDEGYVNLAATGNDPMWILNNQSIDGGKDHIVRVRIKRTAGSGWQGTLYYGTSGHSDSESYRKTISDTTVTNEWVVLEYDMSNLSAGGTDWVDNTITRLRFDWGNSSSDTFQVDWIAVGTKGAAPVREGGDVISGTIGGTTITGSKLYQGGGTFEASDTGFYLDDAGQFSLKDKLSFDGTTLNVEGAIAGGSLQANTTTPIPTNVFTRSTNQNIPTGNESGTFMDLSSGSFVFGDADSFISFAENAGATAFELDIKGVLAPTKLDFAGVTDTTVMPSNIKASGYTDASIGKAALSDEAYDEIARRLGNTGGFYTTATGFYLGSTKNIELASAPDHGTDDIRVRVAINDVFTAPAQFAANTNGVKITVKLFAKKTTDSAYLSTHQIGTTQTFVASPTILQYATRYTIDESYEVTLVSGTDIEDNTDYDFKVELTRLANPNAFQAYGSGGANDSTGTPVTLEVSEGTTVVAGTGNANTLDSLDSTQFLRSDTDDTFDADLTITGALHLQGDLNITGDLNSYNVTDLDVSDRTITVNAGGGVSSSNGAGLIVDRGTAADASILWDETSDKFDFNYPIETSALGVNESSRLSLAHFTLSSSGTALTLQNKTGGSGANVGLDFLTYNDETLSGYANPAARISAVDDGQFGANLVFYGKANAANGALSEIMKVKAKGGVDFTGNLNWSGGGSANANTAYTYSQVGHLPLAGGTMSGAVSMGSNNLSGINNATAVSFLSTNGYWSGGTQRINGSGDLVNIGTITSGSISSTASSSTFTSTGVMDINLVANPPELNFEDTSSTSGTKRARWTLDNNTLKAEALSDNDGNVTHSLLSFNLSNGTASFGDAITATGTSTFERLKVTATGSTQYIDMYVETGTANIADDFTDTTTQKSYIYLNGGVGSNDPGFIMHETADSNTNDQNKGVLHLVPSDDNSSNDYVSIHGTNDADCLRLDTAGRITTASNYRLELSSGSSSVYVNDSLEVNGIVDFNTLDQNGTTRVDGSGNATFGTVSATGISTFSNSSEEVLQIKGTGSSGAIHFYEGSTRRGILGFSNGGTIQTAADNDDMVLRSEQSLLISTDTTNHYWKFGDDGHFTANGRLISAINGNNTGGGNLMLGSTTNNAAKWFAITGRQYNSDTETEGYSLITGSVGNGVNNVFIGGGLGEQNAATIIQFMAASNTSTRNGTEIARINTDGLDIRNNVLRMTGSTVIDASRNITAFTISTSGQIDAGGRVKATNWLELESAGAAITSEEAGIRIDYNDAAAWYIYKDNSNNAALHIQSTAAAGEGDGTPRVRFARTTRETFFGGNVGINQYSITSGYALDVNGGVKASGGVLLTGSLLSQGHSSGDNWMPYTDGNFYIRAPNTYFNNNVYIDDILTVGVNNSTTNAGRLRMEGAFSNTSADSHPRITFNDDNFGIGTGGWATTGNNDDLYLWSYNGAGRKIRFAVTTNGGTDVTNAAWTTNATIDNDGNFDLARGSLEIGGTTVIDSDRHIDSVKSLVLENVVQSSTTNRLYQNQGTLYWDGAAVATSGGNGVVRVNDGDSSAPSFSFTNDTDTGMYSDIADGIRWAVGGQAKMSLVSTGLGVTGTVGASAGFKIGLTQWMDSSFNMSSIGSVDADSLELSGTNNLAYTLDVTSTQNYAARISHNRNNNGTTHSDALFLLNTNSTSSANFVQLGFSTNSTDGQHHRAVIRARHDTSITYGGILELRTRSGGGTQGLGIRIDANSDVDLPNGRLAVNKATASVNPALDVQGVNTTDGTASFRPDSNKGTRVSHVHYGANGDWYIRSASNSGTVYIQDGNGDINLGTIASDLSFDSGEQRIVFGGGGTAPSWTAPVIFRTGSATLAMSDYSGVELGGYNGTAYGSRFQVHGSGVVEVKGGILKGMSHLELLNNGGSDDTATSPRLYSPASGTLAFSCNGDERLRISSAGHVGIGLGGSTPSVRLQVTGGSVGSSANDELEHTIIQGSRHKLIFKEIRTAAATDWNSTTYRLQHRVDSTNMSAIDFVSDASYGRHIDFRVSNNTFAARIDSGRNFNIGIATAYSGAKLSVNGSIVQANGTQHVIGTYGTSGLQLIGTAGGDNIVGTMGSSEPLIFRTASQERMRLNANGGLDVTGNIAINGNDHITTARNVTDINHYGVRNTSTAGLRRATLTYGASDSSFQLNIANGEGTTTDSEQAFLGLYYGSTKRSGISFHRSGDSRGGDLVFSTWENTERMRIEDFNGNVGIGVSPSTVSTEKLKVGGSIVSSSGSVFAFGNVEAGAGYVKASANSPSAGGFYVGATQLVTGDRDIINALTIQQDSATDCGIVHPRENLDGVPLEDGLAYFAFNHNTSTHPSSESTFDTMERTNITTFKQSGTWDNAASFTLSADSYLTEFHGYVLVSTAGNYRFGISADDATDLYIDGVRMADHYGGHGAGGFVNSNSRTEIYLEVGYHKVFARFEEVGGGDSIRLGWNGGSGTTLSAIPAANLYHDAEDRFKSYDGTIYGVGNLTMTANVTAYSDEKLKSNIETLDGSKVYDMRGVSFTKDGQAGSGVIAQELEKVAPELVHDGEYKSVAYGNLVGYLIEAVKDHKEIIDNLTQRIEELENGSD